jgi:uncharacterized protein (TIGR02217 family)
MFLETPRFPACPRYGFTSEPMRSVTIITRKGGQERRNLNWAYPLQRITLTVGPSEGGDAAVQELLEFWHAVGGEAYGFRVKDYADFKSCYVSSTPAATDQPLEQNTNSPTEYQMVKRYTAGALSSDRIISKPVQGTILIADNGTLKTETTHYTVDYTTGLVTLNFTPSGPMTWGGEFDVPMRFDGPLPIEIVDLRQQSASFSLKEIRIGNE